MDVAQINQARFLNKQEKFIEEVKKRA